jgi:hypothetical protein
MPLDRAPEPRGRAVDVTRSISGALLQFQGLPLIVAGRKTSPLQIQRFVVDSASGGPSDHGPHTWLRL